MNVIHFSIQLPNVTFFMTTGLIEIYLVRNFVFVLLFVWTNSHKLLWLCLKFPFVGTLFFLVSLD